ncbi:MAG: endonuclease V [Desulfobacterota bacterium]|jgi:deoxyribonuclease V|nr:endonuclease V [Thermodesulfobacteriota bacterium]
MNLAAFDVYYGKEGWASAAAVLFPSYDAAEPAAEYTELLPVAAPYVPGEFFRRELPPILALLHKFDRLPDEVIVDRYVLLGDKPGLGYHLFTALGAEFRSSAWPSPNLKARPGSRSL